MRVPATVASLSLLVSAVFLSGCSASFSARSLPTNSSIGILQGQVHGGQQPVAGAQVYLYAAGTSGPGAPSTSLLTSDVLSNSPAGGVNSAGDYYVTTNPSGVFEITGDYTCTAGTQVYLYSVGGNAGFGINTAAGLLAALGQCPAGGTFADTISFVYMSEVSTIAAAYALAGFATDATHVSGPALTDMLGQTGFANAFANAAQMYSIKDGGGALLTTPNGYGTVPQTEINYLANILAACINTADTTSGTPPVTTHSGLCNTLLSTATATGTASGAQPTDTATAAINIAHFPGSNIATLFALPIGTGTPFPTSLTPAPNDFTIAIAFNDTGTSYCTTSPDCDCGFSPDCAQPFSIAIDASGNAWITNFGPGTVSRLSPLGAPIGSDLTGNGLTSPDWIAIADSGNIAVLNDYYAPSSFNASSTVSEFLSSGTPVTGSPFNSDGLSYELAFDGSGDIWLSNQVIASNTGNITELTPSGTEAPGSPFIPAGSNTVTIGNIAIDGHNNVWVTAGYYDTIKLNSSGAEVAGSPFVAGGAYLSQATAIDASGNVFFADGVDHLLGKISNSGGATALGSPYSNNYSGGELVLGNALVVDGSGNLWASNFDSIMEVSNTGYLLSPSITGYTSPFLQSADYQVTVAGLALDGSGDVWVTSPGFQTGYVLEFIGASTPVVTPIATGVKNNTLGTRP